MNNLRSCAAAALLCSLAACAATPARAPQAGDLYGPAAGQSEFTFGGSVGEGTSTLNLAEATGGLIQDSETTITSYDAQIGLGYYLTDNHEVGGQAVINLIEQETSFEIPGIGTFGGDQKTGDYGFYPYYRYNFRPNNRMQYYVGAHAGIQQVETPFDSSAAFSYGAHVGFKSWLTPSLSFFVEPRLTLTNVTLDLQGDEVEQDITDIRTLFGLTFTY